MTNLLPFHPTALRERRARYWAWVHDQARHVFRPDGAFQPATENDARIVFWLYPALLAGQPAFANVVYAAAPGWENFNVFLTSSIAVNLARERHHMRPDLIQRSEEHLARFALVDGGRGACSGCNDYTFHGYNDNMPALSVRALILTGDLLGRKDCADRGLFHLEGLCAHFERRGLLSEYTSGTYTPLTLTALMDVVECATNRAAQEMAAACAHRILLDIFGHWHAGTGTIGGAQSRAYRVDATETTSTWNALLWYLTGHPLCLDPIEALRDPGYDGPLHHAGNRAFNLAAWAEVFGPGYESIAPGVRAFAAAPRVYPYEIHATSDGGQMGQRGGVTEIQTRAFHQPQYFLGTASHTWFDQAGQQLALHGAAATVPQPQSWRDRVAFWHRTQQEEAETGDSILDVGKYHTLQQRGSALVLGTLGPALLDREVSRLTFNIVFSKLPAEHVPDGPWHFLRFGEVFIGVRAAGIVSGQCCPVRHSDSEGYLRLEVPLVTAPVRITEDFREWCDYGYVLEIAAQAECGSFAAFRRQCRSTTWELYHAFYRNSRYCGRHGELQIVDSVAAYACRFMAIDGAVEPRATFAATGLDARLTRLFPDGRRIRQRRLLYDPACAGSPFNPGRTQSWGE